MTYMRSNISASLAGLGSLEHVSSTSARLHADHCHGIGDYLFVVISLNGWTPRIDPSLDAAVESSRINQVRSVRDRLPFMANNQQQITIAYISHREA